MGGRMRLFTQRLLLFLICLFTILITSQICKADNHVFFNPAGKVVIYKGPWQNLTPLSSTKHYGILNIPSTFQLMVQFTNFDAGATSVNLTNLYCSVDPTVTDFDSAPNPGKFSNISFSYNGGGQASANIAMAGGPGFTSGAILITGTLPCSTIIFEFNSATQVATNVEIVAYFTPIILSLTGAGNTIGLPQFNAQGVAPVNGALAAINPLAIGGQNDAGNSRFARLMNGSQALVAFDGLLFGDGSIPGANVVTTFVTLPDGMFGGPLGINGYGKVSDTTNSVVQWEFTRAHNGGFGETQPVGVLTAGAGFQEAVTFTNTAASVNHDLWGQSGGGAYGPIDAGMFHACTIRTIFSSVTGTTPTLDIFIQDSDDGTNWADRVHMAQITSTANSKQIAGFGDGAGGTTPVLATDGVLAVATKIDGPVGTFGREKAVITGTTPSFTGTVIVNCL